MSKSLINACKKKNELYKVFIKKRSKNAENKYKRYKNKLTSILRCTEKQHYADILEKNRQNTKMTWEIVNSIIKRKSCKNGIPNIFSHEGKEFKGYPDIVNGFNEYFVNVGANLAKQIRVHEDKDIFDYMNNRNPNSMFMAPVTENEVNNMKKTCKNKTSEDSDNISMSFLKDVFGYVVKPFTYICNLSFECGIFPNSMKTSKVIPQFKSGNKSSFSNYRPVSLLSQFSKILEKLFDKRLQSFMDKNCLISECQYGFRSGCSTSNALMELIEEISSSLDNKKATIGVFIDLKKAFDTIDHTLLIRKLDHYGIHGLSNNWVKSYLEGREQFVQVDEYRSNVSEILCGVPQGSVLGPKLFILYINNICNVSKLLKFILFADDTNILNNGDNLEVLCKEISTELNKLHIWFDVNKLSLKIL